MSAVMEPPVIETTALRPSPADEPLARGAEIQRQTVCLEVHFYGIGFRRSIKSSDIVTDGTDTAFVHVSKDLIDQKELRAIRRLDGSLKAWLASRSVPSRVIKGNGKFLVPLPLVIDVDRRIVAHQKEREELVREFVARYDELKATAAERLMTHYNEADYPPADEVAAAFTVEADFIPLNVPAALRELDRSLFERKQQEADLKWADATVEIREALRVAYSELVTAMTEKLGTDEEGKPKVFRESLVTKIKDFLDTFESRNLTNDEELSRLTRQARELLGGVAVKDLRENQDVRAQVLQKFEQFKGEMDSMVTVKTRKFSLDEDV